MYTRMQASGYSVDPATTDQHAVMTFFDDHTIGPDDTVSIYSVITTVRNGPVGDLLDNVAKARQWLLDHVVSVCQPGCCKGIRGNANGDTEEDINISDITYLINYLFGTPELGPAPPCQEEGNANGDTEEDINISDITYLVDYLFGTPLGPPPPTCP